jgi:Rod binding domain-containing protein
MASALPSAAVAAAPAGPAASRIEKARVVAQEFEAVFIGIMLQHMVTGLDGEGPFGAAAGTGIWRSFLTDEYARSVAARGGLGIADAVYQTLIAAQETGPHLPD